MIDLDRHMQGNAFIANDFLSQKKKKKKKKKPMISVTEK